MNTEKLNERLLVIGEKIKAKGWPIASISIYVNYLAPFDRDLGPHDPMISFRPSISASTRDPYGSPTSHEFVRDAWDVKTMDDALAKLEESADNMPTMAEETKRFNSAKAKLSDDERRLLGVR